MILPWKWSNNCSILQMRFQGRKLRFRNKMLRVGEKCFFIQKLMRKMQNIITICIDCLFVAFHETFVHETCEILPKLSPAMTFNVVRLTPFLFHFYSDSTNASHVQCVHNQRFLIGSRLYGISFNSKSESKIWSKKLLFRTRWPFFMHNFPISIQMYCTLALSRWFEHHKKETAEWVNLSKHFVSFIFPVHLISLRRMYRMRAFQTDIFNSGLQCTHPNISK